jgi:hypothetical protein
VWVRLCRVVARAEKSSETTSKVSLQTSMHSVGHLATLCRQQPNGAQTEHTRNTVVYFVPIFRSRCLLEVFLVLEVNSTARHPSMSLTSLLAILCIIKMYLCCLTVHHTRYSSKVLAALRITVLTLRGATDSGTGTGSLASRCVC